MPSTFYLDLVNGSDAAAGTSWGTAWKTWSGGPTAARIAPGDTIRVAKTPDPTSIGSATWTNKSQTVTLADATLTKNVATCDSIWTASANVTPTTSSTRKEGAYSASLAIAAAFATGLVAYYPLGAAIDFSGYKQLSFWIQNSLAIAAGNVLKICLCSDAAGATPVDTFYIPAIPSTGAWCCFTVNKGSALGNSIQSVAVIADSDPGTITLLLDNIIACKDATSADSLSLTSMISKESAAYGGTHPWWGIQSINGATVKLDYLCATGAEIAIRGYWGATGSATTYKRETFKAGPFTASTTTYIVPLDKGSGANWIYFSCGWNTSNDSQDGETFLDGVNGLGRCLCITAIGDYVCDYSRLSITRFTYAISMENGGNAYVSDLTYSGTNVSNCLAFWYMKATAPRLPEYGISFNYTNIVSIGYLICDDGAAIYAGYARSGLSFTIYNLLSVHAVFWYCAITNATEPVSYLTFNITYICNAAADGFLLRANTAGSSTTITSYTNCIFNLTNVIDNAGWGINLCYGGGEIVYYSCVLTCSVLNNNVGGIALPYTTANINGEVQTLFSSKIILGTVSNNGTYGIYGSLGAGSVLYGPASETLHAYGWTTAVNPWHDQYNIGSDFSNLISFGILAGANVKMFINSLTTSKHKVLMEGGQIIPETTGANTHAGSGIAWKLQPTSAARSIYYPVELPIAKVACEANKLVTVSAWFKRDNAGITGRLICKAWQLSGITSDQIATMTLTNSWEQLTITFTPTIAGVVEILAQAYGGTAYTVWVDDMTISQAA